MDLDRVATLLGKADQRHDERDPRRDYHFENKLLPRFHAYLWSDWSGGYHRLWLSPKSYARTLASVQSVLGFGGDGLVLGGLALLGFPAFVRVLRGTADGTDKALALLTALSQRERRLRDAAAGHACCSSHGWLRRP